MTGRHNTVESNMTKRPALRLIEDKRKARKQFKFPYRYHSPITNDKPLACRIIHTFQYAHRWGETEMCVVEFKDTDRGVVKADVDMFSVVPKFRLKAIKSLG